MSRTAVVSIVTAGALVGGAPAAHADTGDSGDVTDSASTTRTERTVTSTGWQTHTRTVTEPKTVEGEPLCADGEPSLDSEQRRVARVIWEAAEDRDAPVKARVIAFAAAMQESTLRDLDGGHADSVGVFQMRPSFPDQWGTAAELDSPEYQAARFFEVLQGTDWEHRSVTEAAQGVLRSAYPDAYADHVDEAAEIVGWLSGTGCDRTVERDGSARFA